jgi:hypothetical protein
LKVTLILKGKNKQVWLSKCRNNSFGSTKGSKSNSTVTHLAQCPRGDSWTPLVKCFLWLWK